MMRAMQKMTAPLSRRIRLIVGRAVVGLVNDSLKMQGLQINLLAGEVRDNVERFQEYGFTSHPLPGAEAVVVFAGGNRDHGLVIAVDDRRYRLKSLQTGEVAIYSDEGDTIILKRGKVVEVNTDTFRVNAATLAEINSPTFKVNASIKGELNTPLVAAAGNIKADLDITDHNATTPHTMAGMRDIFNRHPHTDPQGGITSVPTEQM